MIHNFNNFINEELRIDKLDEKTLDQLKKNLMHRLSEYKTAILANIVYNMVTNKVEYKETEGVEYFDLININIILRELNNEFSEEVIKDLNVESFLRNITQILELRKRNTKRKIREAFDNYYNTIEERISKISRGGFEKFGIPNFREYLKNNISKINEVDPLTGRWSVIFK